jgi:GNAT superfamily N-acetyltransferase
MNLILRPMTVADIPLGMKLKTASGWNQLEADWQRQLTLEPLGCFVAERDGQGVGTACACVFGPVAWVSMVLVDAGQRGQGIGTALLKHVLAYLDARAVPSIRLDATPQGRPLYEKLGFTAEFTLQRFAGTLSAPTPIPLDAAVEPVAPHDLSEISAADRRITGTDRARLWQRLYEERPEQMRLVRGPSGIEGFTTARPGANAWQLGPCLGSANACRRLLRDAWRRLSGHSVFLDVPVPHTAASAMAREMGLAVQRPLLRMGRGPTITENLDELWTSFGPEKG